jgi:hypothetical protein
MEHVLVAVFNRAAAVSTIPHRREESWSSAVVGSIPNGCVSFVSRLLFWGDHHRRGLSARTTCQQQTKQPDGGLVYTFW